MVFAVMMRTCVRVLQERALINSRKVKVTVVTISLMMQKSK